MNLYICRPAPSISPPGVVPLSLSIPHRAPLEQRPPLAWQTHRSPSLPLPILRQPASPPLSPRLAFIHLIEQSEIKKPSQNGADFWALLNDSNLFFLGLHSSGLPAPPYFPLGSHPFLHQSPSASSSSLGQKSTQLPLPPSLVAKPHDLASKAPYSLMATYRYVNGPTSRACAFFFALPVFFAASRQRSPPPT